ncbi:helix-turn-helix transcriptional regulator [uncultured Paracoccus sp.]|uniref:helix-turn-helix domain-containing protein n=1 Tax=uncultured Paracoccus sp. TaxID=189685 RepID=UPI002615E50C|nr:helix-turn-helix transcriptional regulator [uncultured Paracoccus sp.]
MSIKQNTQPVGALLRGWRERRRHSQLSLASEAEISQRHLSFLESGRSSPSREMILRLAETLRLPLRDRNELLLAAGFAPAHGEATLQGPDMAEARAAIDAILAGHAPHPALAVDRGWTILKANAAVAVLTEGAAPHLLEGQVNALRLSLHPEGVAPRIVNYGEWRAHVLSRLANDIDLSSDARLIALRDELKGYPAPPGAAGWPGTTAPSVAVPLVLRSNLGRLSFLSTTTVFGTAVDITLAGIAIESFFPADAATAAAMLAPAGAKA